MKILFEITHPKHFHLFRNAISDLSNRRHQIAITVREKDITTNLLRASGFPFTILTRQNSSMGNFSLALELLLRDWRLFRFVKNFSPDVIVARVGPSAAHVGFLLKKPVVVFEDTEDGNLQQKISFPFADRICTAKHYEKDWGKKHIRYSSFDELAYLHPNRFTPNKMIPISYGLVPGSYIIVRFVSWQAAHDVGQKGISIGSRVQILNLLEKFGRVLITSEAPLPPEFEKYKIPSTPEHFHDLLAFSKLTFGESSTVATEGAMLGVPGILVNTMNWGSVNRLVRHYKMLFQTASIHKALQTAIKWLGNPLTLEEAQEKRKLLLRREVDLTDWMVKKIESFENFKTK